MALAVRRVGNVFYAGRRPRLNRLETDCCHVNVRTAQKWERDRQMPIRRLPGGRGRAGITEVQQHRRAAGPARLSSSGRSHLCTAGSTAGWFPAARCECDRCGTHRDLRRACTGRTSFRPAPKPSAASWPRSPPVAAAFPFRPSRIANCETTKRPKPMLRPSPRPTNWPASRITAFISFSPTKVFSQTGRRCARSTPSTSPSWGACR